MTTMPSTYRTDSLFVASFLMTRGIRFCGVEHAKAEPRRHYLYFLFDDDGSVPAHYQAYLNNADVPVGSFVNALNSLKGVIRQEYKVNGK